MKKAIKAALCILSALTISSVCAVSASAGTLTKEELFLKYLPDGADETLKFSPAAPIFYVDNEGALQDYVGEANAELERLRMLNDAGLVTDEEFTEIVEPMISRTLELTDNAVDQIVVFNAYRRGAYGCGQNTQWFIGADYENGFYYVLLEDGTASIVGADQNVFQEATVLEIPAEIGGVPVTKIEDRAFDSASKFMHDLTEIVIPDSVVYIGEGAFCYAICNADAKINLPANVKSIGRGAYYQMVKGLGLEYGILELPESVEFVGYEAFDTISYMDMPDSLVLIENHSTSNQDREEIDPILLDVSYTDIWARDRADVEKILKVHNQYSSGKTFDEYIEGMLNSDLPLTDLEKTLIEKYGYWYITIFYVVTEDSRYPVGTEKQLEFCDKYDMDQQLYYPLYTLRNGVNSFTFLHDDANFVDLDDAANFFAGRDIPKMPQTTVFRSGDVDGSGETDVADAVLLARFCNEDEEAVLTAEGKNTADANGDGLLTLDDVTVILQIITKLI